MSFGITICKNTSPLIYVTKDITELISVNGTLREGTSILDPSIKLEIPNATMETLVSEANYVHIPEFGRYYYITNIYMEINNLWVIDCHVDVLMSYSDQIRAQTAIVSRQENVWNLYLDDGSFMAYQNPLIQTKYFSNETPFENESYVLVVSGSTEDEQTPSPGE